MNRKAATFLLRGEFVITCPSKEPIRDGAVAIKGDKILGSGSWTEMKAKFPEAQVIKRPSGLVAPGLINCHTHAPMVLLRGMADDLPLKEWLEKHIFPAEAKLTGEIVKTATLLACAEMIRSGTTTFVDMYFFERQMAEVVDEVGIRAYLGEGIFDFPSPAFENAKMVMEETSELVKHYKDHPRINFTVDPHTPYTCSSNVLVDSVKFARSIGLPIVIHLSETKWEFDKTVFRHSKTPVQYLEELGLLGPDLIAVHCVWLQDKDIELLAQREVNVVHCPESNLKLASGISPVAELLEAGVNVALGTDGAASNNNLDMLGEMDFAAKIPKGTLLDPTVANAEQILHMATIAGAQALGAKDLGRLETGYQADLIVIDLDKPHLRPCYNPVSQIVYAATGCDVSDVMVAGKFIMENRELLTIDEEQLLYQIKSFQNRPFWQGGHCN